MFDGYPLGPARRAGGIDHVSEIVGVELGWRIFAALLLDGRQVAIETNVEVLSDER